MASAHHEQRGAMLPATVKKKAKKKPRPGLASHMQPPGGLRELVVEFRGPPPFRLCGRGDVVSEGHRNWPQRVLHIPDIPHIIKDPPNPDFLKRCGVGWDNDGRREAVNCFVRRIHRGWRVIEVNRIPLAPEDVPAVLAKVQDTAKYTITFDFTSCWPELYSTSTESADSEDLPRVKADEKAEKGWKCPKSFPLLHQALEGHLYIQPSRVGSPRWKHPEKVAGTRHWYEANKMSYKRHAKDAGRGDWVRFGPGATHAELPRGVPRWPATKVEDPSKKNGSFTSKVAHFISRDMQSSAESLLSLSGSRSLPSLVLGQVPYPPTPAFVRDLMRRWCQEDAKRQEDELRKLEEEAAAYEAYAQEGSWGAAPP